MKLQIKFDGLKLLTLLGMYLWFVSAIRVGFYFAQRFYNFFDNLNINHFKNNKYLGLTKMIEFRQKFNLKKFISICISKFLKFFRDWYEGMKRSIISFLKLIPMFPFFLIQIFTLLNIIKKRLMSISKIKHIFKFLKGLFRLFKELFNIFFNVYKITTSLYNYIFYFHSMIFRIIEWRERIFFLFSECLLITRLTLCFIFLGLLGIILGFLSGVSKHYSDISTLRLLLLLEILYSNGLEYAFLEPNEVDQFLKFSPKTLKQIDVPSSKIILEEFDKIFQIPFPIFSDPFIFIDIDIDFIWEEPFNYKFELFKFYKNTTKKISY